MCKEEEEIESYEELVSSKFKEVHAVVFPKEEFVFETRELSVEPKLKDSLLSKTKVVNHPKRKIKEKPNSKHNLW